MPSSPRPLRGVKRRDLPVDHELILGIRKRDESALAAMMEKYSSRVFATAFRVLRCRPDAQEVTQDVFLALWRFPDRFDATRGRLATWLVILSRSRALDLLRQIETSRARAKQTGLNGKETLSNDCPGDRKILIEQLLTRLPREQATVMRKVYLEGCTVEEAAGLLDAPLGTMKSRARLALHKLRFELRPTRSLP
jgi:RNA polymerase sigma-70 factor (ECF subfamily)